MKADEDLLIEKFIDSALTDSELAELKALVKENEELRNRLNLALEMKGMLQCTQNDQYDFLEDNVLSQLSVPELRLEDRVINELKRSKKKKQVPVWLIAFAAILVLSGVVLFLTNSSTKVSLPNLAKLKDSQGQFTVVRSGQNIVVEKGQALKSGDLLNISNLSHLTIEYKDGSTLIFYDNSFAKISSLDGKKSVELYSGKLQANVEKQAVGKQMEFITKHSKSVILGTSFTLTASDESSILDVREGKVSFSSKGKTIEVGSSQYAIADEQQEFKVQESKGLIYKSPLITWQTPNRSIPLKVNIKGSKKIFLVVSNGGDNGRNDHAAWKNPRLVGINGTMYLSREKWDIGKVGHRGEIRKDDLVHNGIDLKDSLYAHATSVFSWTVPEGYHTFEAEGVLLDTSSPNNDNFPSVNFEVHTHISEKDLKKLLRKLLQF